MSTSEDAVDVTLSTLRFDGQTADVEVIEAITSADLERPIDGAPTLALGLHDKARTLIQSPLFNATVTCQIDTFAYELVKVSKSGDDVTAVFEDLAVASLRRHNSPLKVAAGAMSRPQFAQRLITEEAWIRLIVANVAAPASKVELARGNPDAPPPRAGEEPTLEESWTASGRVLDEIGWRRFVAIPNQITIAPDSAAIAAPPNFAFKEFTEGVDMIDFDYDVGKPIATATVNLRAARWFAAPGIPVMVQDLGAASGVWLIGNITGSLFSTQRVVTLVRARPVLPEPEAPQMDVAAGALGPLEGAKTATGPGAGGNVKPFVTSAVGYMWPVRGTITSGFGRRSLQRYGEDRSEERMHEGIDIAVNVGTPVMATKDGTVSFAGEQGGYGNVVYVEHEEIDRRPVKQFGEPGLRGKGKSVQSRYGHLSRITVRRGVPVKQGDVLGLSGGAPGAPGSGDATGPHVHFEIRVDGVATDPLEFLGGTGTVKGLIKQV